MKRFLWTYLLLIITLSVAAEGVTFEWKGRTKVVQGRQFQLEFVSTGAEDGDVKLPQFKGCTELYRGSSRGTSVSIINGNVSRTITNSIIVTLRADEEGTHNIEPATLTVNGETYKTAPIVITVLKADEE